MENRYYYMDRDGRIYGPHWLTAMRNLWQREQLNMGTEVRFESSQEWHRVEYHPEIYEMEIKLPTLKRMAQVKSNPVRLLVWTMLLLFAYLAYLVVGEAHKLGIYDHTEPPAAADPKIP